MEPLQLILTPQQAASEVEIRKAVAKQLRLPFAAVAGVRIIRRSVDARQRNIRVMLTVEVIEENSETDSKANVSPMGLTQFADAEVGNASIASVETQKPWNSEPLKPWNPATPPLVGEVPVGRRGTNPETLKPWNSETVEPWNADAKRQVVIVGAGPAGLFAALTLLERGIRPIVLERGKAVSERKKDIALLNRNEGLNSESNYCFGEGGAGTFSDGKLFSRSKKRGDMQRVMEIFYEHGADERVLYETHAHIGSDRLPAIIRHMRETILEQGGEVHFETKVTRVLIDAESRTAYGVASEDGREFRGEAVILAIGHSAHDTYRMLQQSGVRLEAKGFAMGVRVEHEQALINRLMYHLDGRSRAEQEELVRCLGNASYSLKTQVDGRGVYSFCMCPGGHIVPAGSDQEGCVVNGMSASHRNSPYANSGMVVEIRAEDIAGDDPLRGLLFQEQVEHLAFEHGARPNKAPAQQLRDFVEGRASHDLPPCSYLPGVVPSRMDQWLPKAIGDRLRQGFRDFDRKYPGFLTNEAVVLGVESRSSSSVRIPRDRETLEHIEVKHLYPCGEGAGYAGGITSSALDGINAALRIAAADELKK